VISDLLQEINARNHVRVMVRRATRGATGIRHKQVMDELYGTTSCPPTLALADHLRMLQGKKPIYLREALRRMGGIRLVAVAPNLRTNVGINFCAANLAGTDGGQVAQADYIALSNNTITPAAADTSATSPWSTAQATDTAPSGSTGEWTGLGLTRAIATMAHTANATSYTAAKTFTATSASTSSRVAGLFGGAARTAQSSGATNILFLESTFTATSLATNDQLALTWTINI
jgi:hypothetical protein